MTQITLSDEQARLLGSATLPVVLVDSRGRKLAEVPTRESSVVNAESMTEEEWEAEGLRRLEQARREGFQGGTTQEVLARLRALKPE